jgi:hypothetical protein
MPIRRLLLIPAVVTTLLASTATSVIAVQTEPETNQTCAGNDAAAPAGTPVGTVSSPAVGVPRRVRLHPPLVPGSVHPDFNGDGIADVAVEVPCLDLTNGTQTLPDAGAMNVIYGSPAGLAADGGPGNQFWTQSSQGIRGYGSRPSFEFGHVATTGDFNGDGYDDLVVHSRATVVQGTRHLQNAGAINVIYGGPNGLQADAGPGNQFWTLDAVGIPGQPAARNDFFGRALAAGDFNDDGYQDLAVGIPQRTPSADLRQAGAVVVLSGGPAGLTATDAQYWTQGSPGIVGQGMSGGAEFGRALAARDFNGDGYLDLAIGPRQETIVVGGRTILQAGAVNVIYGGPDSLQADAGPGNQFWTESTPGLLGNGAQAGNWFGRPIKAADFNRDGYGDLAIGVFLEAVNDKPQAGLVHVIYGGPDGLAVDAGPGNQIFTEATPGIPGSGVHPLDWFGRFMTPGDFNGDGYGDLSVQANGVTVDGIGSAGQVTIIYGGPDGLTPSAGPGAQIFNEDTAGFLGGPAAIHDWFGHGNGAAGDFDADGYGDLAIGAIYRDLDGLRDAGAFDVLYGTANGLSVAGGPGNQYWTGSSPGLNGPGAQDSASFGGQLAQAADGGSG